MTCVLICLLHGRPYQERALEPEDICEELMNRCLSPDCQMGGLGCDNMTCVLICLLHGRPYQEMVEKCATLSKEREEEIRRKLAEELEDCSDKEDTETLEVT